MQLFTNQIKVMKKKEFLGIDVSKVKVDVCIYSTKQQSVFENKGKGFKKMLVWLKRNQVKVDDLIICFEHTGMYSIPLQIFCEDQAINYVQVSGLQVKRSLGLQRGKNDKVDSFRLAEYTYLHRDNLRLTKLESKHVLRLKQLLSYRSRLVRQRAGYKSSIKEYKVYLSLNNTDVLIKSQQKMINVLSTQVQEIESEITDLINQDQKIKQQHQLATSVSGIGTISAAYIIAYTNCFKDFKAWRKFACYVGSAPFEHNSGSSIHGKTRISQYANKSIKAILTNAAKAAISHNPEIRHYYKRKIKEGKHKKVVVNNVRNKLISRVFATVKRGTPCIELAQFAA